MNSIVYILAALTLHHHTFPAPQRASTSLAFLKAIDYYRATAFSQFSISNDVLYMIKMINSMYICILKYVG